MPDVFPHIAIMLPIFSLQELRTIEATHGGLMDRAGKAALRWIARRYDKSAAILLLAGPGNNGGDAIACAHHLRQQGYQPTLVLCTDAERLPAEARQALSVWEDAGGDYLDEIPDQEWTLVVDGLLGIGLNRAPQGFIGDLIEWLNDNEWPVLALDTPSGLNAFTGVAPGACVRADWTLSLIGFKPGLLTGHDSDRCGQVFCDELELGEQLPEALGHTVAAGDVARLLPLRPRNSHKGRNGSVGVIGGATGMIGACLLAGRAALHAGAGRVYLGLVDQGPSVDCQQPELMIRRATELFDIENLTTLVIGPGLGDGSAALQMLDWALRSHLPLVLDADALNLIAHFPPLREHIRRRAYPTILTPHPAEAARLLYQDTVEVEADRVAAAQRLAREYSTLCVLKGAGSIVAFADGEYCINTSGNPGQASAGQGDVLSGIIGALLAQGISAGDALLLGVYAHGAAADALVTAGIGPIGLTASETSLAVRDLLNRWQQQ